MITEKEAKNVRMRCPDDKMRLDVFMGLVYESRGRCDQCIHIGELGIICRHWYMKTEPDGYCHKFKRGEPK